MYVTARPLTFSQACSMYVHRFTMEHIPRWALERRKDGTFYAPQFHSDEEWYANTKFEGEEGWAGMKGDCYTTGQTWPLGQSLPVPYPRMVH